MSRSSQTALMTVTFDPTADLAPLTTTPKQLVDDVELYLRRVQSGALTVTVSELIDEGHAWQNGTLVASFTFGPLGGESLG